jgi:hypothetical protein
MTQTTFSTIEVDSKFWLAPEPFEFKHLDESKLIKIKEEHTGEFKGRTGLKETVDFQLIREVLLAGGWTKAVYREWWEDVPEDQRRMVAIPINTDQGRTVAVPIGEGEDELTIGQVQELFYYDCHSITAKHLEVFAWLGENKFTIIKRKQ